MAILVTCFVLLSLPRLSLSAPAPPPCSSPVDVAFLIDSSGSLSGTQYQKEKNFVKEVAKSFGSSTRPGSSSHSSVQYLSFSKGSIRPVSDRGQVRKAVDGLPHERGFTRIDRALVKLKLPRSSQEAERACLRLPC
ncbi:hypothetical protein OS493_009191 [Desmophyllum pertusum]|uniref:VWFA domain-containing protein n=1 Tax=Desmophyllum pertusum TaxID=174260 RepID=A0A9W9Z5R2_9CNID|nr:hypothetical protein OS493_009191 [Desmophyllum pertusum]